MTQMILLITSSICSTADVLVDKCNKQEIPIFRFNTDRYFEYKFMWKGDEFEFIDPTGRTIHSSQIKHCLFYKSQLSHFSGNYFNQYIDKDHLAWVISSINNICLSIFQWAYERKLVRYWMISELYHTKTRQMILAKKYFKVPEFTIHFGFNLKPEIKAVKPFTSMPINNNFIYTKKMDVSTLHPNYPWITQEYAKGNCDATVVFINGKVFPYHMDFERKEATDWRHLQGGEENKWVDWIDFPQDLAPKIEAFMKELNLPYGRLDFMIGGEEPEFLEVNPCGQFGWLDDEDFSIHQYLIDNLSENRSTLHNIY